MRSPRRPCDFWEPTSLAAIRRFFVVETVVRTAPRRLAGQIEFRFETLVPLYDSSSSFARHSIDQFSCSKHNQWCISAQGFATYRLRTNSRRHTQRACTSREQPWRAAEAEDAAAAEAEAEAGAAGPASSAPSPRTTQIESAARCVRTPEARHMPRPRRCRLRSQMKKTTTSPRSSRRRRASASIPNNGPAARARS